MNDLPVLFREVLHQDKLISVQLTEKFDQKVLKNLHK